MNRERAETFLRLLAEAQLRDLALPWSPVPASASAPFATVPVALHRAAWALTAVGALDQETADGILADIELAVATRGRAEPPEAGVIGSAGPGWAGGQAVSRRFAHAKLAMRSGKRTPRVPTSSPPRTGPAQSGPRAGRAQSEPDRYVPVGVMILFHDQMISGELDLMSYAHTAGGARFTAGWRTRDPLGSRCHGLPPVEAFTVTDDRGNRYDLLFDTKGRPESICDLGLRPDPPPDIGWLEVTAPGEQAVRVNLDRRIDLAPAVTDIDLSVGEHLLNRIAERLLLTAEFPAQPVARAHVGPAVSLGAAIDALEAAEVLPGDSPVPGRLAALCASLGLPGHGITAAPASALPEPWFSLLSHYRRRKPGPAPAGDGFAAVAAALPELDGLRLVLLGLHNYDGGTWMNTLTLGQLPVDHPGPLGLDLTFPLSVWVRDDAGRWHVARPSGWYAEDGEAALTLRLTPPLTRSSDWIEVLASGRTAEVRATLPLRWGDLP
jgi:hypothetical protein